MRTRRVLRRYEKEEEVGRLPVERLEIDAREAPPEGRQHALQAGQLAVRDGNAVPERGAVQALAVLERLDQPLPVDLAVIAGEDAGELLDHVGLAAAHERPDDGGLLEDVRDLHGSIRP